MAEKHTRMLLSLLPPGRAWRRAREIGQNYRDPADSRSSNFSKVFGIFGDELEHADERRTILLTEKQVSTVAETLPELESEFNVPIVDGETDDTRRSKALARMRMHGDGGMSQERLYGIAEAFGFHRAGGVYAYPMINIVSGCFPGFKADFGRADIDKISDNVSGDNPFVIMVYSEYMTEALQTALFDGSAAGTELVYSDERVGW